MGWFGLGKDEEGDGIALPLGARLGARVRLDDAAYRRGRSELAFDWPQSPQTLDAVGDIDLGDGVRLTRLYLSDDAFVQVETNNGSASDVNLFVYAESIKPKDKAAFERWVSAARLAEYTLAGVAYQRVWDEGEGMLPPVVFDERVYKKDLRTSEYCLTLYSMLYSREVPGFDRNELLLVAGEDSGPEDFIISQAVGIPLRADEFDFA